MNIIQNTVILIGCLKTRQRKNRKENILANYKEMLEKAKEVSNGCLEEKPNKRPHSEVEQKDEDIVIVETEE